jgi:hypothetical protein
MTVFSKRRRTVWSRPPLDARIGWIEKNPHFKRGEAGRRFSQYHGAATVQEYLRHVGTWADLRYDLEHDLFGLCKPDAAAGTGDGQEVLEPTFVAPGGIYVVMLKNADLISTQAHDRRFDGQDVPMVNRDNRKFGKALDFSGRERQGYDRTFGAHNVNFLPVIAVADADRVEAVLKHSLLPWRLRPPAGRLTEWTAGIEAADIIGVIVEAVCDLDIPHTVLRTPGG